MHEDTSENGSDASFHDAEEAQQESQAGATGTAFTVLHEKTLSQQVVLGSWCPTMDLLALVGDDGQLAVYRLEWQRLWGAVPDGPVTALAWRPDGKVLAAGLRHGAVSLYAVEACELLRTLRTPPPGALTPAPGPAPVCHLSWVQGIPPHPATATPAAHLAYRYRHMRFFPAPPPPGKEQQQPGAGAAGGGGGPGAKAGAGAAGGGGGDAAAGREWPAPPDALDVLVVSDTGGCVSMLACGEVLVALLPPVGSSIGPPAPAGLQAGESSPQPPSVPPGVVQSVLSRDLARLVVTSVPTAPVGAEGGGSPYGGASLSVYGCGKLGSCQGEVLELSLLGGCMAGRLEAAAAALGAAARAWKAASGEVSKRFDEQLREVLSSHGHDPDDAVGELTCVLASGHVSAPLQAFLTGTLSEPGLRRLAKTVDAAVQELCSRLLHGVIPALQLVAFLAGELRGRARAAAITQALGLQEREVCVLEVEAAKALVQAEVLRQVATRVGCQYRAFFTWLLKTMQALEEARGGADGDDPHGPGALGPGGHGSLAGVAVAVPEVLRLLQGQLQQDQLARDLDASQSTLGLPVASTQHYPPHLLPHLKRLQEVAFPFPPPPNGDAQLAQGANAATTSTSTGGAAGGGSSWPDRPLQRQLGVLGDLCRGAFGRLQRDVSPTMQLLARIPLLPELAAPPRGVSPGSGGDPSGLWACAPCCITLPQIRTEPLGGGHNGEGPRAALLSCLVPPAVAAALGLEHRGQGGGGGAGGRTGPAGCEALLLMRFVAQGSRPLEAAGAEACLVVLPVGLRVLGMAGYREGQLALMLGPPEAAAGAGGAEVHGHAAAGGHGGGHGAGQGTPAQAGGRGRRRSSSSIGGGSPGGRGMWVGAGARGAAGSEGGEGGGSEGLLALLPTEGLAAWREVQEVVLAAAGAAAGGAATCSAVAEVCARSGAVAHWPVAGTRTRAALPGGGGRWAPPLCVSGPRGLAAACSSAGRALMVDLEEDEEDEEGEEEGEEADGEGEGDEGGSDVME